MYNGSLALAGECMCTRPFSMRREPGFLELARILREADTTYCHLEMNIFEHGTYLARATAASALQADPIIAKELKWLGIDLVSAAYNHSLDYGIPGLLGTIDSLNKAGLVHAGIGNNLEEAREPRYFESPAGRVAIISISSGHYINDSAGAVKSPNPGRPGVNPLRIMQKVVLPSEDVEKLKEIWTKVGMSMRRHFRMAVQLEPDDVCLNTGDAGGGQAGTIVVKPGDKTELVTYPHPHDIEANLRAINDARRQADLVLVAHHAACNDGERGFSPCKWVTPFAQQCIDEGADAFIGHGWHRQLGFEIYNGKPIWYGTGNFFAQSQFLQRIPADTYEGHGFDLRELAKLTPADLHDAREDHMGHWKSEPGGVIAVLDIDGGELTEMKLYPFSVGYEFGTLGKSGKVRETGPRLEGRPILTDGEDAEKIIDNVKKLSEKFNTNIEYKDGIGVIKIK